MNGKYLKEIKENSLTSICESLNEMKALYSSHFSNKVLELFKGTGSVGHVAKEYGFEVISLDNEAKFNPDILMDIMEWDYKSFPIQLERN